MKKYNNKGLLARSDVCDALGVTVDGYKDLFIRKIAGNSELIQNIVSNLFYNQPIVSELQNTLRNRQSLWHEIEKELNKICDLKNKNVKDVDNYLMMGYKNEETVFNLKGGKWRYFVLLLKDSNCLKMI